MKFLADALILAGEMLLGIILAMVGFVVTGLFAAMVLSWLAWVAFYLATFVRRRRSCHVASCMRKASLDTFAPLCLMAVIASAYAVVFDQSQLLLLAWAIVLLLTAAYTYWSIRNIDLWQKKCAMDPFRLGH